MSDIFEIEIVESPLEIVFNETLEVSFEEDNFEVTVDSSDTEVVISSDDIEILTIAEQGPSGVFPVHISNTPPVNPVIGDLWLNTDI